MKKIKKLKKEKFEHKCFFGITSNAHIARVVSLLNKYTGCNFSLLENDENITTFFYNNPTTEIYLLKNKDFNLLLNPNLRGIDYLVLLYTSQPDFCETFFTSIRMLNKENDIVYASKILEKDIDKKYRF